MHVRDSHAAAVQLKVTLAYTMPRKLCRTHTYTNTHKHTNNFRIALLLLYDCSWSSSSRSQHQHHHRHYVDVIAESVCVAFGLAAFRALWRIAAAAAAGTHLCTHDAHDHNSDYCR